LLQQENKSDPPNNDNNNNNHHTKGSEKVEETKAAENPISETSPEKDKFVCNLQNSSTVAKGFDVSFNKKLKFFFF